MEDLRSKLVERRYRASFLVAGVVVAYVSYTLLREALGALVGISRYPEAWTWWLPALAPACAAAVLVSATWRRPGRTAARIRSFAIGYGALALVLAVFIYTYYA